MFFHKPSMADLVAGRAVPSLALRRGARRPPPRRRPPRAGCRRPSRGGLVARLPGSPPWPAAVQSLLVTASPCQSYRNEIGGGGGASSATEVVQFHM